MPDATLKVGDVVRLKSGSPRMSVTKVTVDQVSCTWFDMASDGRHGGELQGGDFPSSTLVLAPDEPKSPPSRAATPAPQSGIRARLDQR